MPDLGGLTAALQLFVAFFGAYILALWIGLIIWTFRDVRARSQDIFTHLVSVLMVVFFNVPGILLYFLLRPRATLEDQYERELSEEVLLQDIEEKTVCPACQQKIHLDFLFCPNCHTKLKRRCDNCHRITSLRWNICPYCGAPASAPTTPSNNE